MGLGFEPGSLSQRACAPGLLIRRAPKHTAALGWLVGVCILSLRLGPRRPDGPRVGSISRHEACPGHSTIDLPLRPAASSPGELLGYEIDVGSHKPPANLSGCPGSKRLTQSHLATIYSEALPRSSFITPFSGSLCQLRPAQALGLCCL